MMTARARHLDLLMKGFSAEEAERIVRREYPEAKWDGEE